MRTFKTLLLREWLQYWRGWVLVCAGPALLMVGLAFVGDVQVNSSTLPGAATLFGMVSFLVAAVAWAIAFGAASIQAPGLARRDHADRSIEFWLSLPAGHWQSTGALLCAHFLIVPLAALLCGFVGGWVAAPKVVSSMLGAGALDSLSAPALTAELLASTIRQIVTTFAAMLWASPFILLVMAASAWLKRWGVPLAVLVTWLLPKTLTAYGWPYLADAIQTISGHVLAAPFSPVTGTATVVILDRSGAEASSTEVAATEFANYQSAGDTLQALASPLFLGVMLTSGLFAWLLVLHRERGS